MDSNIKTRKRVCQTCGVAFDAYECSVLGLEIRQLHCDDCCAKAVEDSRSKTLDRPEPAQIPKCYQDFDINKLPSEISKSSARKAFEWKYNPVGIGLIGKSMMGKSFILHELMRRWLDHKSVMITTATEFAWIVGAPDQTERRKYLEKAWAVDMLYVDDFGKEKMTERVESDFYHVLEMRRRNLLPVFVTVNGKGKDLARSMSTDRAMPIINRLKGLCEFLVVE